MVHQGYRQQDDALVMTQRRSSEKQLPSIQDLASDGFDTWWARTSARHAAVFAQASSLVRALQRVNAIERTRIKQSR